MRFRRIIVLAAAILLLLPVWGIAQQPLRVAVLPFTIHSQEDLSYLRNGIWDIISTRIIVEGQIEVVEKSLVERFLTDLRGAEIDDQQARWLGTRVGAAYVVYGSITKVGEYISLDAKIVNVAGQRETSSAYAQHKGMDEVMTKIDSFAQDISSRILGQTTSYEHKAPGQLRQNLMYQALGYTKILGFPGKVLTGVDIGDVDGDGKNEIVVMDHNHIWVYRDAGKEIKLIGEFEEGSENEFRTLDVVTLPGDKKAVICVTNTITTSVDSELHSFILAYEDGSFRYLAKDLPWYLRAKKLPGQGECLLAQRMGTDRDYEGSVCLVEWKKGKPHLGKRVKLPSGADWIYSFTPGHFTSPEAQEFLLKDEEYYKARIVDEKGAEQWRGGEKMGGSDNSIDRFLLYKDRDGNPATIYRSIFLPPRIVAKDLSGDGQDEVVAVFNEFPTGTHLAKTRSYDKAHIVGLTWDGINLTEAWRTQDIPGYIADFQVKDEDNDGRDELVTVSVNSHPLGTEAKSLLLVFKLYE
jgi:TolB-like protein